MYFVGIDWVAAEHAVYVLDQTGQNVTAFTIDHTAAGFARLATRLDNWMMPTRIPVALHGGAQHRLNQQVSA